MPNLNTVVLSDKAFYYKNHVTISGSSNVI